MTLTTPKSLSQIPNRRELLKILLKVFEFSTKKEMGPSWALRKILKIIFDVFTDTSPMIKPILKNFQRFGMFWQLLARNWRSKKLKSSLKVPKIQMDKFTMKESRGQRISINQIARADLDFTSFIPQQISLNNWWLRKNKAHHFEKQPILLLTHFMYHCY